MNLSVNEATSEATSESDRDDDVELKVSCMVKRSQGKSTLGLTNFKTRVFVLTPSRLTYYDGSLQRRGSQKGYIDLSKIKVVEKVLRGTFNKPSFQVTHGDLTLYVIANSETEQQEWVDLLQTYCSNNTLLQSVYHPGLFTHGRWSCCHHRSKYSLGCTLCFCGNQQEEDISPTMATTPVTTTTISVPRGEVPLVHCTSHTPSLSPTHVAWEINWSQLTIGRSLGRGQFGQVMGGKWRETTDVAIRTVREEEINEKDFIEGAGIMMNLQHDNLVKLHGVCRHDGCIFIVQELMMDGSLLQYLRQNGELIEKTDSILDIALQICSAMFYLEEKRFIHRNLAARNCFIIKQQNTVKVGDYGLARFHLNDDCSASESSMFSFKWQAPESLTLSRFSMKSDVWSFGVLLWELWTGGNTPYPTLTNSDFLEEVLMGYRLEKPQFCPSDVYDLMKNCWQINVEDRPTFQYLQSSLQQVMEEEDKYEELDLSSEMVFPQHV